MCSAPRSTKDGKYAVTSFDFNMFEMEPSVQNQNDDGNINQRDVSCSGQSTVEEKVGVSWLLSREDFLSAMKLLGFQQDELDELEVEWSKKGYNNGQVIFHGLYQWEKKIGDQATTRALVKVLRRIGRGDVATQVFPDQSQESHVSDDSVESDDLGDSDGTDDTCSTAIVTEDDPMASDDSKISAETYMLEKEEKDASVLDLAGTSEIDQSKKISQPITTFQFIPEPESFEEFSSQEVKSIDDIFSLISSSLNMEEFWNFGRCLGVTQSSLKELYKCKNEYCLSKSELIHRLLDTWSTSTGIKQEEEMVRELEMVFLQIGRRELAIKITNADITGNEEKLQEIISIQSVQKKLYSSLQPLPSLWLKKETVELDELFVEPMMYQEDKTGREELSEITLKEIFVKANRENCPRILIEGLPGYGKTTLLLKLLSDWSKGVEYVSSLFDLVFFIPLRIFKGNVSNYFHQQCQQVTGNEEETKRLLASVERKALLILDGWDEATTETKRALVPLLMGNLYPHMTVILTKRTGYYVSPKEMKYDDFAEVEIKGKEPKGLCEQRIQIKGVFHEKINELLRKYLQIDIIHIEKKFPSSVKKLKDFYYCPLFLLMLGVLVQDTAFQFIRTKTELYKAFFNFILKTSLVKENSLDEESDFDIFNPTDNIDFRYRQIMIEFGKICLAKLKARSLIFSVKELKAHMNDDSEVVMKLGFLSKGHSVMSYEDRECYETIHRSFTEFMAVFYLSVLKRNELREEIVCLFNNDLTLNNEQLLYSLLMGLKQSQSPNLFSVFSSVNGNIGLFDTGRLLYLYYLYPLLDEIRNKVGILNFLEPFLTDSITFNHNNTLPLVFYQKWLSMILGHFEGKVFSKEWKLSNHSLEGIDFLNWVPNNYVINRLILNVKKMNVDSVFSKGKCVRCNEMVVIDEDGSVFRHPSCLKAVVSKFKSQCLSLVLNCSVYNEVWKMCDAVDGFFTFYRKLSKGSLKMFKFHYLSCVNVDPKLFKMYSPFIEKLILDEKIEYGIKISFSKYKNISFLENWMNSFLNVVANSHLQSLGLDVTKIEDPFPVPVGLFNGTKHWKEIELLGKFICEGEMNKLESSSIKQDFSHYNSKDVNLFPKVPLEHKYINKMICKDVTFFSDMFSSESLIMKEKNFETVERLHLQEAVIDKKFLSTMKMFNNLNTMTVDLFKLNDVTSVDDLLQLIESLPSLKKLRLNHHMESSDVSYAIEFLKKLSEKKQEGKDIQLQKLSVYHVPINLSLTDEFLQSFEENIENVDLKRRHLSETTSLNLRKEDILRELVLRQQKEHSEVRVFLSTWMDFDVPLEKLVIRLEANDFIKDQSKSQSRTIDIEDLFEGEPRRIMVESSSRLINTIFCCKILSDWSAREEYVKSKFKMIFHFQVKDFNRIISLDELLIKKYPVEGVSDDEITTCVTQYQDEILLIVEGIDEMNEKAKNILDPVFRQTKYPGISVIILYNDRNFCFMKDRKTSDGNNKEFKHCFHSRILIKILDAYLDVYVGHNMVTRLHNKLISVDDKLTKKKSECPLFLFLFSIMIQSAEKVTIKCKTTMYKNYFNFLVHNMLETEKQVNIFKTTPLSSPHYKYFQILNEFGKYALQKLKENSLLMEEKQFCSNRKDENILKFGILTKTSVTYEPVHKSFLEFLAAFHLFNILRESGEDAFRDEIERVMKAGLLPTGDSLFFAFIGGLLNDRASLLFAAILPLSSWFNLENVYFKNILLEITNIHSFLKSFQSLLPSFTPPYYNFDSSSSVSREFCSSSILSMLLNSALERNLIQILQCNHFCSISINKNVTINHLCLYLDNDFPNTVGPIFELKCKMLSLAFLSSFKTKRWSNVISFIESINRDEICFQFNREDESLNSSLLICLHRELTEGLWKEKTINRLILKFKAEDDPKVLHLLIHLVNNKKIKDGVSLWIEEAERNEEDKKNIQTELQELFYSVVKSKTLCDFDMVNEDSGFSPTFDFSYLREEEITQLKSLQLNGSLAFLNVDGCAKFHVEEAVINFGGDVNKNCECISYVRGLTWLWCGMGCFDLLVKKEWENLNKLEELTLSVEQSLKLNLNISTLNHLQVLTLEFDSIKDISSEICFNFGNLFSSLKIFQLCAIPPDILSFDLLVDCVVKSLEETNEVNKPDPPHLEELLVCFQWPEKKFDWDSFKESMGIKRIQRMLRKNLIKRLSWVDYDWNMPYTLPRYLFPLEENFAIKVEAKGSDSLDSRYMQWFYRWNISWPHNYRITFVDK